MNSSENKEGPLWRLARRKLACLPRSLSFDYSFGHRSTIHPPVLRLVLSGPRPLPLQKRLRRAPPAPHPAKQSFHPKVVKTNTRHAGGTSGFSCILSAFYTLVLDAGLEGVALSYVGVGLVAGVGTLASSFVMMDLIAGLGNVAHVCSMFNLNHVVYTLFH
jgi:hypothetical protein